MQNTIVEILFRNSFWDLKIKGVQTLLDGKTFRFFTENTHYLSNLGLKLAYPGIFQNAVWDVKLKNFSFESKIVFFGIFGQLF